MLNRQRSYDRPKWLKKNKIKLSNINCQNVKTFKPLHKPLSIKMNRVQNIII